LALSKEVRRLQGKWQTQTGWPKRLDYIEISGLRGWEGQRFNLAFPIMAIVGENGVGKSTVLQACASVYRSAPAGAKKDRFPSDFFPETPWDTIANAEIRYAGREGPNPYNSTIRKPTNRWRGNPDRRQRPVQYLDLRRIQPVPARVGYTRLANPNWAEVSADEFEKARLERFSGIMGRTYDDARMVTTDGDLKRPVPVIGQSGMIYSGFHQGAGETTIAELLQADIPQYSLVLIDEIESSLHPRAQRRLIRDLAERARERELQVVLTTHSPYVLQELPFEARACILQSKGRRQIVYGVSPDFAMTKMDDVQHAECDLYTEDERAAVMVSEILVATRPQLREQCQTIPYGAASVGQALGQMAVNDRFPRPTVVFLDGDKGDSPGCVILPGEDAPERVVFEALRDRDWLELHQRTGRTFADVADACNRAMTLPDHHSWITEAANRLFLGSDILWQSMCAEWATKCLSPESAASVIQPVEDALLGLDGTTEVPLVDSGGATETISVAKVPPPVEDAADPSSEAGRLPLFDQ
jgi:predicted ATPase